jgi:hypothetical protein
LGQIGEVRGMRSPIFQPKAVRETASQRPRRARLEPRLLLLSGSVSSGFIARNASGSTGNVPELVLWILIHAAKPQLQRNESDTGNAGDALLIGMGSKLMNDTR